MQITELGYHSLQSLGETVRYPDGLPERLLLCAQTPMQLELEAALHTMQAGGLCLLAPHTPFAFSAVGEVLVYDWVLFTLEYDADFYTALHLPENRPLRFADVEFFTVLLRQLSAEFYTEQIRRSDMLDCLMKAMLIRLSETAHFASDSNMSGDSHYAELVRLREKIYANPQEKWTVDLLCAEVNMSRSYFQLVYRETFGMTCIADVINCKMNRARELLTATAYTISHIAALCGYDNEEHFMRQFKKNNGMTPTAFRKRYRE